jgi:hypothetical protein
MKAWLAKFYAEHIQKTMGLIQVAVGFLSYIDSQTIHLGAQLLGPKWGPIAETSVQVGAGLVTAYRAFQVKKP